MPGWLQVIVFTAAAITAVGVIWKFIVPTAQAMTTVAKGYPLMEEYVDAFHGTKNVAGVLAEIAAQFRSDSGSTLRDSVDRLEALAIENTKAITKAERAVESAAAHAQANTINANRAAETVTLLKLLVDRLGIQATEGAESNARIEVAAAVVAADLADAHTRADEAQGPHGAAADAFGQSGG